VRDIGDRIRRYRLTRFGPRDSSLFRRLAWVWPILGLWGAYVLFLGEHSVLRIWRLSRENQRMQTELISTRHELDRLEGRMNDPNVMRERAEHMLRERSGWAKKGEIIYRIPESQSPRDSLAD
jgi:cell division protein FtsB